MQITIKLLDETNVLIARIPVSAFVGLSLSNRANVHRDMVDILCNCLLFVAVQDVSLPGEQAKKLECFNTSKAQ